MKKKKQHKYIYIFKTRPARPSPARAIPPPLLLPQPPVESPRAPSPSPTQGGTGMPGTLLVFWMVHASASPQGGAVLSFSSSLFLFACCSEKFIFLLLFTLGFFVCFCCFCCCFLYIYIKGCFKVLTCATCMEFFLSATSRQIQRTEKVCKGQVQFRNVNGVPLFVFCFCFLRAHTCSMVLIGDVRAHLLLLCN